MSQSQSYSEIDFWMDDLQDQTHTTRPGQSSHVIESPFPNTQQYQHQQRQHLPQQHQHLSQPQQRQHLPQQHQHLSQQHRHLSQQHQHQHLPQRQQLPRQYQPQYVPQHRQNSSQGNFLHDQQPYQPINRPDPRHRQQSVQLFPGMRMGTTPQQYNVPPIGAVNGGNWMSPSNSIPDSYVAKQEQVEHIDMGYGNSASANARVYQDKITLPKLYGQKTPISQNHANKVPYGQQIRQRQSVSRQVNAPMMNRSQPQLWQDRQHISNTMDIGVPLVRPSYVPANARPLQVGNVQTYVPVATHATDYALGYGGSMKNSFLLADNHSDHLATPSTLLSETANTFPFNTNRWVDNLRLQPSDFIPASSPLINTLSAQKATMRDAGVHIPVVLSDKAKGKRRAVDDESETGSIHSMKRAKLEHGVPAIKLSEKAKGKMREVISQPRATHSMSKNRRALQQISQLPAVLSSAEHVSMVVDDVDVPIIQSEKANGKPSAVVEESDAASIPFVKREVGNAVPVVQPSEKSNGEMREVVSQPQGAVTQNSNVSQQIPQVFDLLPVTALMGHHNIQTIQETPHHVADNSTGIIVPSEHNTPVVDVATMATDSLPSSAQLAVPVTSPKKDTPAPALPSFVESHSNPTTPSLTIPVSVSAIPSPLLVSPITAFRHERLPLPNFDAAYSIYNPLPLSEEIIRRALDTDCGCSVDPMLKCLDHIFADNDQSLSQLIAEDEAKLAGDYLWDDAAWSFLMK